MTAGLVLSGGASRRMGQPKALLQLGGVTLLERLVRIFAGFCDPVVVVTGAHHAELVAALPSLPAQLVFNEKHQSGMFSSMRKGVGVVSSAERILFSPVDFAGVKRGTIEALLRAPEASVVKPRWQGVSGHPVLIGRAAISALLAAPAEANAKEVLSALDARYVDVEDPFVAHDCDTPEDYERLIGMWQQA